MSVDHKDPFSRVNNVSLYSVFGLPCVLPVTGEHFNLPVDNTSKLLCGYEDGFVFKRSPKEQHVGERVIANDIKFLFGVAYSLNFISNSKLNRPSVPQYYHPETGNAAGTMTWAVTAGDLQTPYIQYNVRNVAFTYFGKCCRVPVPKEQYALNAVVACTFTISNGVYDTRNIEIYDSSHSNWALAPVQLPGNKRIDQYVTIDGFYVSFVTAGQAYEIVDEDEYFIYIDLFYYTGYYRIDENNVIYLNNNYLAFKQNSENNGYTCAVGPDRYLGHSTSSANFASFINVRTTKDIGECYSGENRIFMNYFNGYYFEYYEFSPTFYVASYSFYSYGQSGWDNYISIPPDPTAPCGPYSQCCLTPFAQGYGSFSSTDITNNASHTLEYSYASANVIKQNGVSVKYNDNMYVKFSYEYTRRDSFRSRSYLSTDCTPDYDIYFYDDSYDSNTYETLYRVLDPWGMYFNSFGANIKSYDYYTETIIINNQVIPGFSFGSYVISSNMNELFSSYYGGDYCTSSYVNDVTSTVCSDGDYGSCSRSIDAYGEYSSISYTGIHENFYNFAIEKISEFYQNMYPLLYSAYTQLKTGVIYEFDPITRVLHLCLVQFPMTTYRSSEYYINKTEEEVYADAVLYRDEISVLFNSGVSEAAIIAYAYVGSCLPSYVPAVVFIKNLNQYKAQLKAEWDQRFTFPNAALVMVY